MRAIRTLVMAVLSIVAGETSVAEQSVAPTQEPDYRQHVDYVLGEKVTTELVAEFTVSLDCKGKIYTRSFEIRFGSKFVAGDDFWSKIGSASLNYTPCALEPESAKWDDQNLNKIERYLSVSRGENEGLYTALKIFNEFSGDAAGLRTPALVEECLLVIEEFFRNSENSDSVDYWKRERGFSDVSEVIEFFTDGFSKPRDIALEVRDMKDFVNLPIEYEAVNRKIYRMSRWFERCVQVGGMGVLEQGVVGKKIGEVAVSLANLQLHIVQGVVSEINEGDWMAIDHGFFSLAITGNDDNGIIVLCEGKEYGGEGVQVLIRSADDYPKKLLVDGFDVDLDTRLPVYVLLGDRSYFPVKYENIDDLLSRLKKARSISIQAESIVKISARGSSKTINWVTDRCEI